MRFYLLMPFWWVQFWFLDAPKNIVLFFVSLNKAFLELFSLPLLITTYFKPWKNEYRKGIVGFSIGMGMFIKSIFIPLEVMLFLSLVMVECVILLLFLFWPIATIALLYTHL